MKIIQPKKIIQPFAIAIVVSSFNEAITNALLQGALQRLQELEVPNQMITVVHVPGAVEIPLTAQRLAKTKKYEAIICLGVVIRGDTDHYDAVCQQVNYGCQKVALEQDVPLVFEVLMTESEELAMARAGGEQGNKGSEAVDIAMNIVSVLWNLPNGK